MTVGYVNAGRFKAEELANERRGQNMHAQNYAAANETELEKAKIVSGVKPTGVDAIKQQFNDQVNSYKSALTGNLSGGGSTPQPGSTVSPQMGEGVGKPLSGPFTPVAAADDPLTRFKNSLVRGQKKGGRVVGPAGKDMVPAKGPQGEDLRLSKNEYILPEEVVEALGGAEALDKLVESITGEKPVPGGEPMPPLPGQMGKIPPYLATLRKAVPAAQGGGAVEEILNAANLIMSSSPHTWGLKAMVHAKDAGQDAGKPRYSGRGDRQLTEAQKQARTRGMAGGGLVDTLRNRGRDIDAAVEKAVRGEDPNPRVAQQAPKTEPATADEEPAFDREAYMKKLYGYAGGGAVGEIRNAAKRVAKARGYKQGGSPNAYADLWDATKQNVRALLPKASTISPAQLQALEAATEATAKAAEARTAASGPLANVGRDLAARVHGLAKATARSPIGLANPAMAAVTLGEFAKDPVFATRQAAHQLDLTKQEQTAQPSTSDIPVVPGTWTAKQAAGQSVKQAQPVPAQTASPIDNANRIGDRITNPRTEQQLLDALSGSPGQLRRMTDIGQGNVFKSVDPKTGATTYSDSIMGTGLGQRNPPREDAQTMEELRGLYRKDAMTRAAERAALGQRGVAQAYAAQPAVTAAERTNLASMKRQADQDDALSALGALGNKGGSDLVERKFAYEQGRDQKADERSLTKDRQEFVTKTMETYGVPGALSQTEYASTLNSLLDSGISPQDALYAITSIAEDPRVQEGFTQWRKKQKKVYSEGLGAEVVPMEDFLFKLDEFLKQ
jgi:hypothetical protein